MMKLGAEKSMRLIVAQLSSAEGFREVVARTSGLCFEPGATLDALKLQNKARRADAPTLSAYFLPAAAAFMTSILSLEPGGILAKVTADLLAVAILPTLLAVLIPGLNLLFDIDATENRYQWRTFIAHVLVPALVATAAARFLAPFSGLASILAVMVGYCGTARLYFICCDDWGGVPERRRLPATIVFMSSLMTYGLFSALLFHAGLVP